jgi:hypothetical protein
LIYLQAAASIEEIKACIQKSGELLLSYIQHWRIIKNSAKMYPMSGQSTLSSPEFIEEMGRLKPKKVSKLMI